jgi:hypothetical protein
MRTVLALLVLLAPALDAQFTSAPDPLPVRLRGFRDAVRLDTVIIWSAVHGPGAQTYRNVIAVLDSLKIPVEVADSTKGRLHHAGFIVRSRLAGLPVSRSFRCGSGPSGEYADYWRVNVAYAIWVQDDGHQSRVGVAAVAGASDIEGASKPGVPCATTGGLPILLARLLDDRARR